VFKKDDDTRDVDDADDAQLETKKDACPICHSDMHAKHPPNSGWYCVLCGYEEDEDGNALI
jgi:ribosomal protein S27AE